MFRWSRAMAAPVTCLVVLTASVTLSACTDNSNAAPDRISDGTSGVTAPAPGTSADDVLTTSYETFDGASATLATYEGKPLVVNFFASWCVPCITEMPDFESLHKELGDRVTFVGMNYNDQLGDAKGIVQRTKVTYDLGRDVDGTLLQAFGGVTMPTTALVRADGTVAKVRSGAVSKSDLRDLIRDELGVS